MLDVPDTEIVRTWLRRAFATDDIARTRAALAKLCGVEPQAVSGWLRTGRITKKNLEIATGFFGHGPSFTRPGTHAQQPVYGASSWPFSRIDIALVNKLAPDDLLRLEGAWLAAASQLGFSLDKRRSG